MGDGRGEDGILRGAGRLAARAVGEERVLERGLLLGRAGAFPERGERSLDVALVGQRLHAIGDELGDPGGIAVEFDRLGLEIVERAVGRFLAIPEQEQEGDDDDEEQGSVQDRGLALWHAGRLHWSAHSDREACKKPRIREESRATGMRRDLGDGLVSESPLVDDCGSVLRPAGPAKFSRWIHPFAGSSSRTSRTDLRRVSGVNGLERNGVPSFNSPWLTIVPWVYPDI